MVNKNKISIFESFNFFGKGAKKLNVTSTIKLLTVFALLVLLSAPNLPASVLKQQELNSYVRWNIFTAKQSAFIKKRGTSVIIKIMDESLFHEIKKDLQTLNLNKKYFKGINYTTQRNEEDGFLAIEVQLKQKNVELFSFYRSTEKKYVLDYWIDGDIVDVSKAAVKKKENKKEVVTTVPKAKTRKNAKSRKAKRNKEKKEVNTALENKYSRDFRYGASFIWDYEPISPKLKKIVDLNRKTPEFFFPIVDRDYSKNDEEAHLQLSVNLYRKKKWGLMYKSIKLYHEKYGDDKNKDFNEYLKANAMLRSNFIKPKGKELVKMVMNMLHNIAEGTKNYELKKSIYKYLLSYYIEGKEYIQALKKAKKLYVMTKEAFDIEEASYALESILYNLAKLSQDIAITDLLKDKIVQKTVSKQIALAYQIYVLLRVKKTEAVVKLFDKKLNSLASPIHPSILYNVAEASFRIGEYKKAQRLFDGYVQHYSYTTEASKARLRIALIYELMGKDFEKTLELYRNAINRSQDFETSYEAKLRYVAMRTIRKKNIDKNDKEVRVFLEKDKNVKISFNLKKLLWLVRLRTFIIDREWANALTYLDAVPLYSLQLAEKRVFEGDGAEIVYGLIVDGFKNSKYMEVVRVWERFKEKYVDKVALDPTVNFMVAYSYIKLELFNGFDQLFNAFKSYFKSPARSFPVWIERVEEREAKEIFCELEVIKNIKLKNWQSVVTKIDELEKIDPKYNRVNYYRAIVSYFNKKYETTIKSFEKYLANQNAKSIYDSGEIADMVDKYADSIYQTGDMEKFKKVVTAILEDFNKNSKENKSINNIREKLSYLMIEVIAGEGTDQSNLVLEKHALNFSQDFPKSLYIGRITYLLGMAYLANKKETKGREVFDTLLKDKNISEYIKGLVRSELSLLKIKGKVI